MSESIKSRHHDLGRNEDRHGERRREDRHRDGDRERKRDDHGGDKPAKKRATGATAVERAKSNLMQLTGLQTEAVSSLNRTRDGWRVVLEVVELERIPRTTDILASYSVELDNDGELMGYERIHRYYRNDVNGDQ